MGPISFLSLVLVNGIQFYITSFFSENDILSDDGMSSTYSAFEVKLGIQRMVYFLVFYFIGNDAYNTLLVLKCLNGIWNVYYLEKYHLVYSIPIRKLLMCLSAIFTTLNLSSNISYIFLSFFEVKIDPIIITLLPGLFLYKLMLLQVNKRLFDISYNSPKKLKKLNNVSTVIYQINLQLNLLKEKLTPQEAFYKVCLFNNHSKTCVNDQCFCKNKKLFEQEEECYTKPKRTNNIRNYSYEQKRILYFVKEFIEKMIKQFPYCRFLRIALSTLLFKFFGNYQLSLQNLLIAQRQASGQKEEFMIFCNMNYIEYYLEDLNISSDSSEQRVNNYPIHKILQVERLNNILMDQFQITWYQVADFWQILSKEELDLKKLEKILGKVQNESKKFNKIYNKIQVITNVHIRSLQIKAIFEGLIYNSKNSLEYNKRAFDTVKMRMEIRRVNRWGSNFMEEMLSYDSCFVTISLEQGTDFCKIKGCNDSLISQFGYGDRNNLIQKNIRELIPKIIGEDHDNYVDRYIQNGQSKNIVFNISRLYGRHKKGYIFPIRMIVKPWIDLKDGLMFVGYLKFWQNDRKLLILTDEKGIIDSMSQQLMAHFKISSQRELDEARYNIQWIFEEVDDFYRQLDDYKHEKLHNLQHYQRFTGEQNIPEAKIEFTKAFIQAKQQYYFKKTRCMAERRASETKPKSRKQLEKMDQEKQKVLRKRREVRRSLSKKTKTFFGSQISINEEAREKLNRLNTITKQRKQVGYMIKQKYAKLQYQCRVSIQNVQLVSANFVVVEISNFELSANIDKKRESSSESSATISVMSQVVKDKKIDSFGDIDDGSVISIMHVTVTQKQKQKHVFVNALINKWIRPWFISVFHYYLIIFFLCLISGSSVFLKYVYPSLSESHTKTLHLDIIQDFKRNFLNLVQCNNFATIHYERPALFWNTVNGISLMSYVNQQQIYFQNQLYDMNIYIESEMKNIRDMPFTILSIDDRQAQSTFWSFIKHVQTYSKRMQLPLKTYNQQFFNKKQNELGIRDMSQLEDEELLQFSDKIFPTNFANYSQ